MSIALRPLMYFSYKYVQKCVQYINGYSIKCASNPVDCRELHLKIVNNATTPFIVLKAYYNNENNFENWFRKNGTNIKIVMLFN